jgi:hypothetical protein
MNSLLIADAHRDLMKERIGNIDAQNTISPSGKEEIIAEFDGGKITKFELDEKIINLPAMYQPRYQSPEAKAEMLEQMAIEIIFFQEARALKMHEVPEFKRRAANQTIAFLAGEYKMDYLKNNLTFTEEEKEAYYKANQEKFPSQTFKEAEMQVMRFLKPLKERELTEQLVQNLQEKYRTQLVQSIIEKVNLVNIKEQANIEKEYIITANKPELKMTVGEFVLLFTDNPNYVNVPLRTTEDLNKIINSTLESSLLAFEAKQQGFDKNKERMATFEKIEKSLLLQFTYNKLVVDKIDVSEQQLRKYYDENIKEFSTLPYKKIQEFVFDDEKTAKSVLKNVKKAKNDGAKINAIVQEHSKNKKDNGYLPNIYQNDIIPGLGKDAAYSKLVWETGTAKLSKIFQNRRNEFIFFRVLEDNKAIATPFEEARENIKKTKFKNEQNELFTKLKKELANKYNLIMYPDKLVVKLSVEEYFNKAEESQKRRRFQDAIYYYDQIIKFYGNQHDDYKALFMKGFILAENLNEKEAALAIFNQLVKNYPSGELHESAYFMIDELTGNSRTLKIEE